MSRLRGKYKLAPEVASSDEVMRAIRGRAPGDPYPPPDEKAPRRPAKKVIAVDSSVLVDVLTGDDASSTRRGASLARGSR